MKKITLTLLLLTISFLSNAQISIPDANFENALVTFGMDTDGVVNGQISTADALAITNLSLDYQGVTDLTGINSFTNLTYFSCSYSNVPNYTFTIQGLETLSIIDTNTTNIDLSNLPNLKTLYIDNNANMASLDVSTNNLLEVLNARNCNLSNVMYNANYPYTQIRLSNNNFSGNIDFTNFTNAEIIDFGHNIITSIDVTGLTNLTFLAVDNCHLTDLDVTTCTNLTNLTALFNDLTCLDLSQNTMLTSIEVNSNDPNLIIVVANVPDANAGNGIYQNWYKDAGATYSTTCGTNAVTDFNFAENFTIYPNPVKDVLYINTEITSNFTLFDITGKSILKGTIQNGINTIPVSKLYSGIYFLKIATEKNNFTKKIVLN